ncbi:MAG: ATP-binding protein [Desulfurivibrionaceae bacterium]
MPPSSKYRAFRLLVFLIITILPLYSVFIMTPLFTDLIFGNLETSAINSARHLSRMIVGNPGITAASIPSELGEESRKFLNDFKILKIKIFSVDGTVVFSTTPENLGETYPDAGFWEKIANGSSYSKIVKEKNLSVDNESFQHDVIETYYPLTREGRLIGAVEIYTNVSRQQKALSSLKLKHNMMIISILMLVAATFIIAEEKEKKHRKEQQDAQNRILHAKVEWEKTFDAIDDVIAIIDPSFTIKRINKAGRERLHADFPELVDHRCHEIFEQSSEICPDCPIPQVIEDGKPHHIEKHTRATGQTLWISAAPLFDEYGHINGFVHTSRDITHQRIMEQQIQKGQKMDALAVLTKGIAHNFRNILAGILMNSQVLQSNHEDDPQIQEVTTWINDSVQAGSKLVTGLMQFSQPKREREFQEIDLAQLIPDAYTLIKSSVGKDVNLTYEAPESLEVMGDPAALFQVLANICANSADAMPWGGDLKIKLLGVDAEATIIITDTGSGMDEKIIDKVFEPFFTTKEVDKGTGLGLSSSYGIIQEHGGDIKIESTLGIGTTVTITLPLCDHSVTRNRLTPLKDIEGLGQRILIVDDEAQAIVPMTRLLDKIGYETASANNCEEALAALNTWRPDLIIIDYNMPTGNGLDCAVEINRLNPSARIIILSGDTTEKIDGIIEERKINFISCCLEKPIGIDKLSHAVGLALDEQD